MVTTFHCGVESSSRVCVTHRTTRLGGIRERMKSARNVLPPSLDCSRQAQRNYSVPCRPADKLNELDHPTLERAFNLDTNIVITRQRNIGAQLFADVDVTLDVLKRIGRIGVQM